MTPLKVPFRIHSNGWLIPVFCAVTAFRIAGLTLALPIGALLLASLLLHEAGHILAALYFRVPVREFGLAFAGAYTRRAYATRRRHEILIAAAGPAMNLLLVIPFLFLPQYGAQLALCNLLLGIINLLPIPSSDGLRILKAIWYPTAPGIMTAAPTPTQV